MSKECENIFKFLGKIDKSYFCLTLTWYFYYLFRLLKAYSGLVYYKALAHYRVKYSKNEFVNNHINGIKNFLDILNIYYLNLMDKEFCFILKSANLYILKQRRSLC